MKSERPAWWSIQRLDTGDEEGWAGSGVTNLGNQNQGSARTNCVICTLVQDEDAGPGSQSSRMSEQGPHKHRPTDCKTQEVGSGGNSSRKVGEAPGREAGEILQTIQVPM